MALFRGAIGTLRKGLAKTRDALAGSLRSLLSGRALDEELIREIEKRLIQADVGVSGTRTLIDGIKDAYKRGEMKSGDEALGYLKREIKAMWPARDRALNFAETAPTVILVAGINGVGKTTSIAKLAKLLRDQDKTVLLGACDTFRAGAVRQLEIWGERLGVDVVKGQQGGDPAAVAFDACAAAKARGVDVLILDTAGRLHTQSGLMEQLSKIRRVIEKQIEGGPHETLLVLDATSGSNALRQAQEFDAATKVTGIMLSKLDGTARGGIVVAIRSAVDIPVKLVGLGETPEDVAPFDPESFVDAMFEIDG